jgi:Protein of unknown function (DUF3237)
MTKRPNQERRDLLTAGLGMAGAAAASAGHAAPAVAPPPLMPSVELELPRTEFVYEAIFDLAPTLMLGEGPLGERRLVPILGGRFEGPRLRGKVLPGGADRQLIRHDGVRRLDVLYELQTDDGAVITVRNQVVIDPGERGAAEYRFSSIELTAPEGPHAWLNRRVFVGTLHSLRPAPQVLIRAYQVV